MPPVTDMIDDVIASMPAWASTIGIAAPVTRIMEVKNLEKS